MYVPQVDVGNDSNFKLRTDHGDVMGTKQLLCQGPELPSNALRSARAVCAPLTSSPCRMSCRGRACFARGHEQELAPSVMLELILHTVARGALIRQNKR